MTAADKLRRWRSACTKSCGVFLRDVGHGLLEVSHNTLALVGLGVVAALLFAASRPELHQGFEQQALSWLLQRQEAREPQMPETHNLAAALSEPDAVARATAADPKALPRQQAAIAQWIARRYRVAPEPISRLVQEAWEVGQRASLEPTLILAIMAIESSFNPFAQSSVGAQGLMQVMTRIHDTKYQAFGGTHAAFDPVTNLRVGVQVLKECIARAGSLEAGLKYYVGAANLDTDGGYATKVLAEQTYLRSVQQGKQVAFNAPLPAYVPPPPMALQVNLPASAPAPATEPAGVEEAPAEQVALAR
jgi:soluble lytic murein transglycosylase-like protein